MRRGVGHWMLMGSGGAGVSHGNNEKRQRGINKEARWENKKKRKRIVAIRKATEVFHERFSGGRHDHVDGGDCALQVARGAGKVTEW